MRHMKLSVLVSILVMLMIGLTVGCGKKKISSEAAYPSLYGSESGEQSSEGLQEEGLDASRGFDEGQLAQGTAGGQAGDDLPPNVIAAFENEDIYFEFDSAALTPAAQEILRNKARWLSENGGVMVVIEGHCDERGTSEYNIALGYERANSAKRYLVTLGIAPSRLDLISYGEERPVDRSNTEEAWARNRRAQFLIRR